MRRHRIKVRLAGRWIRQPGLVHRPGACVGGGEEGLRCEVLLVMLVLSIAVVCTGGCRSGIRNGSDEDADDREKKVQVRFGVAGVTALGAVKAGKPCWQASEESGLGLARMRELVAYLQELGVIGKPDVEALKAAREKVRAQFGDDGVRVLELSDGFRRAEEIVRESGLSVERYLEIVFWFESEGLTTLDDSDIALLNAQPLPPSGPILQPALAPAPETSANLGPPRLTPQIGHTGVVNCVAVTPDGRCAVSGSDDRTLRVWDLATGRVLRTLEGHPDRVTCVAVTPDGRRAVSGSDDKTLRVWDPETGRVLRTLKGHTESVFCVAVTPDGKCAVSGSEDETLRVWDLAAGRVLRTLEGHTDRVSCVTVTPDGKCAVSGADDKTLRVWDLETGRVLRTLKGHTNWVRSVAVTPDGRRAVSGSYDKTLRVWDLETGQLLLTLKGHTGWVLCVAVTPDGRRAVSGSRDTTLRVWDLETGKTLRTLKGHTNMVRGVAVTPDGRRAVSGSDDETLRVWDLATGQLLRTLEGHTNDVTCVAVTPDGKCAVSGSEDETLRVWDLEAGKELCSLLAFADGTWAVVDPEGRYDSSNSGDIEWLHWVRGFEVIPLRSMKDRYYHPGLLARILGFRRD